MSGKRIIKFKLQEEDHINLLKQGELRLIHEQEGHLVLDLPSKEIKLDISRHEYSGNSATYYNNQSCRLFKTSSTVEASVVVVKKEHDSKESMSSSNKRRPTEDTISPSKIKKQKTSIDANAPKTSSSIYITPPKTKRTISLDKGKNRPKFNNEVTTLSGASPRMATSTPLPSVPSTSVGKGSNAIDKGKSREDEVKTTTHSSHTPSKVTPSKSHSSVVSASAGTKRIGSTDKGKNKTDLLGESPVSIHSTQSTKTSSLDKSRNRREPLNDASSNHVSKITTAPNITTSSKRKISLEDEEGRSSERIVKKKVSSARTPSVASRSSSAYHRSPSSQRRSSKTRLHPSSPSGREHVTSSTSSSGSSSVYRRSPSSQTQTKARLPSHTPSASSVPKAEGELVNLGFPTIPIPTYFSLGIDSSMLPLEERLAHELATGPKTYSYLQNYLGMSSSKDYLLKQMADTARIDDCTYYRLKPTQFRDILIWDWPLYTPSDRLIVAKNAYDAYNELEYPDLSASRANLRPHCPGTGLKGKQGQNTKLALIDKTSTFMEYTTIPSAVECQKLLPYLKGISRQDFKKFRSKLVIPSSSISSSHIPTSSTTPAGSTASTTPVSSAPSATAAVPTSAIPTASAATSTPSSGPISSSNRTSSSLSSHHNLDVKKTTEAPRPAIKPNMSNKMANDPLYRNKIPANTPSSKSTKNTKQSSASNSQHRKKTIDSPKTTSKIPAPQLSASSQVQRPKKTSTTGYSSQMTTTDFYAGINLKEAQNLYHQYKSLHAKDIKLLETLHAPYLEACSMSEHTPIEKNPYIEHASVDCLTDNLKKHLNIKAFYLHSNSEEQWQSTMELLNDIEKKRKGLWALRRAIEKAKEIHKL